MRLIAITGGIGSGKSVVSQIVKVMGYQVYDCDQRARALMIESEDVRRQLIEAFGKETFLDDGSLNRQHLSAKAFGNAEALARLNGIVHPATASDMLQWAKTQAGHGAKVTFMETALLRTAGLDRMVDEVWHVTAPASVRIPRVMARSGLSAQQVQDRMKSQSIEEEPAPGEHVIINDGTAAVLPQISQLLFNCKHNNN
jgi:dephospho-CoA kinase